VLGRRDGSGTAELAVGADALQSGVSEAVLSAVAQRAAGEQRAVAIAALTQLVQLGHVPEQALARVTEALARGPEALINLPAQARAEKRQGGPPGKATAPGQNKPKGGPPAGVPGQGQAQGSDKPKGKPPGVPPGGPPG
jgi:X-X-X-Leu-X-X-Gly heptad repeat protein